MSWGEAALSDQSLADVDMPLISGTVFVAATGGDDTLPLSAAQVSTTPWLTIGRVNNCAIAPGATISLHAGDSFTQPFLPMGGGSLGSPVTLNSYGAGAKPAIRPATVLPSSGWTLVRTNVYSIAAPQPVSTPGNSACVFQDTTRLTGVATAALVASPGQCNWTAGTLTIFATDSSSPNATHVYRVCASNIYSPDATFGGHVGIETRWDYLTISGIDVAYTGHANIGQGYNVGRATLGTYVTGCACANTFLANISFYCDNTGLTAPHIATNTADNSAVAGIYCLDANVGWIKHVTISGNTITNASAGAVVIGGSADSIAVSGNTISSSSPAIVAQSAIGLAAEHKPTNVAVTGNAISSVNGSGDLHIVIEGAGQSFGAGCSFIGNTIIGGLRGFTLSGDTSGTQTSGFLVERNEITTTASDGILIGGNATGVKLHANLILACGIAGGRNGILITGNATATEVFNNTIDHCYVGLSISSSGTGSGSHNLLNNTATNSFAQDFLILDSTQLAQSRTNNAFGGGTSGYSGAFANLAAWQAAGFEQGSLSVTPGFVGPLATFSNTPILYTPSGYALTGSSALIAAGTASTLTTDFFGAGYRTPPAIGFWAAAVLSVSVAFPSALEFARATARAAATAIETASRPSGGALPLPAEYGFTTGRAASLPAELIARPALGVPLPAASGASALGGVPWPVESLGRAGDGLGLPAEWRQTTLGLALRAALPLEWLARPAAAAPAAVEWLSSARYGEPIPAEWGFATVSPSAVGISSQPLEWRRGVAAARTLPLSILGMAGRSATEATDWLGMMLPRFTFAAEHRSDRLSGARGSALEFAGSAAGTSSAPVTLYANVLSQVPVPTSWDGHLLVASAGTAPIEWARGLATVAPGWPLETLTGLGLRQTGPIASNLGVAGQAIGVPLEIGTAPLVPVVLAPKLRVGLYGFALKGIAGRYMLGGSIQRVFITTTLSRVGPPISLGAIASHNVTLPTVSQTGAIIAAGQAAGSNPGSGAANVGPLIIRAGLLGILPNQAAGFAPVGLAVSSGTAILLPPDITTGTLTLGSATATGALSAVNRVAGVSQIGAVNIAITGVLNPPDPLVAALQVGAIPLTGTLTAENDGPGGAALGGASTAAGLFSAGNAGAGVLLLDSVAALGLGGNITLTNSGFDISAVTPLIDAGAGSATNMAAGTALAGTAMLQGVIVNTGTNPGTGVNRISPLIASATLFTEILTIVTPTTAVVGTPVPFSGTYLGNAPFTFEYSINAGGTWNTCNRVDTVVGGGNWATSGPNFATARTGIIAIVRDQQHPSASATTGAFNIASSAPAAPTG